MPSSFFTELLAKQKCDALLISNRQNIGYLTDFWGSFGLLLITAKKQILFTDSRYLTAAAKNITAPVQVKDYQQFKNYLNKPLKIGYEAEFVTVAQLKFWQKTYAKTNFYAKNGLIAPLRAQKNGAELKLIKKAARINDQILQILQKNIVSGVTEKALQGEIIKLALELGADKMAFDPIVCFDENSAHPHHHPTSRKLRKGDLILLDFGVKYKHYCSDITRVFFTATPTPLQTRIFQLVLAAQEKAQQTILHSTDCAQIDGAARQIIADAGFAQNFGHSLGHGVGLEIHETPSLSTQKKQPNGRDRFETCLYKNCIFTLEPGVYLPGKFGIRLEDLFVYQNRRAVPLSHFTKKIEELKIKL